MPFTVLTATTTAAATAASATVYLYWQLLSKVNSILLKYVFYQCVCVCLYTLLHNMQLYVLVLR
jgi:hypothetical protein